LLRASRNATTKGRNNLGCGRTARAGTDLPGRQPVIGHSRAPFGPLQDPAEKTSRPRRRFFLRDRIFPAGGPPNSQSLSSSGAWGHRSQVPASFSRGAVRTSRESDGRSQGRFGVGRGWVTFHRNHFASALSYRISRIYSFFGLSASSTGLFEGEIRNIGHCNRFFQVLRLPTNWLGFGPGGRAWPRSGTVVFLRRAPRGDSKKPRLLQHFFGRLLWRKSPRHGFSF